MNGDIKVKHGMSTTGLIIMAFVGIAWQAFLASAVSCALIFRLILWLQNFSSVYNFLGV